MNLNIYPLIRPLFFMLDPEQAHNLTLRLMRWGCVPRQKKAASAMLQSELCGLHFDNPVGLSAGFDKNAEVLGASFGFGFGFVEVGTVTPQPQEGNPKPRVFRDPKHGAVINRMGFPNGGLSVFAHNINRFLASKSAKKRGVIGINIGMNKTQTEPAQDYKALVEALAPRADYLTINISSPNTPGLRKL